MEKCAIYARVSSKVQEEGQSLDVQIDAGKKECARRDLQPEVFNEGGRSVKHEDIAKRPEMEELLSQVDEGHFQYVYVFDFDRLSRNKIVKAVIEEKLRQNRVQLIVGGTVYDLEDEDKEFQAGIISHAAILENRKRAKKSKASRDRMAEEGYFPGGRVLYGYKVIGDRGRRKLEIDPDKAGVLRRIAQWLLNGDSLLEVVERLDKEGIEPPGDSRRKRQCWTTAGVHYMINSTTIVGEFVSKLGGGKVIACPAIISKEEQDMIKAKLRQNRRVQDRKRKNPTVFANGLARCAWCKSTVRPVFNGEGPKRYFRMWCAGRGAEKYFGRGCKVPTLDGSLLEENIWYETAALLRDPQVLVQAYKKQLIVQDAQALNVTASERDLQKLIEDKRKQISKLLDLYSVGKFPMEHLDSKVAELHTEIDSLSNQSEELNLQLKKIGNVQANIEKINAFHCSSH
jgi:DNA invertase Pin-like site-specific DNA recombinase